VVQWLRLVRHGLCNTPAIVMLLKVTQSGVWWYTLAIPTLRRLRHEDGKFKASLGLHFETLS
jgi:hypothetical protein